MLIEHTLHRAGIVLVAATSVLALISCGGPDETVTQTDRTVTTTTTGQSYQVVPPPASTTTTTVQHVQESP